MAGHHLKVLDCTLRDGGYINDWNFGFGIMKGIIKSLMDANIDIIEIGFLRNEDYDRDRAVWPGIAQIKEILPDAGKNVRFSVMALHDKYDIGRLERCGDSGIDMLRVTFHDYDAGQGFRFCQIAKEKGYQVSCNPINIMGYSDLQLLRMIEKVNDIKPAAFAIVDTFGSMDNRDLDRLASIFDHNLDREIVLGLHLHENKAQSFALAQRFIEKHLDRDTVIDASLNGMGRVPGNLSVELITDYLNRNFGACYEIDYLLDAIESYIEPIKKAAPWGYSSVYFLSAKYNLHRNYAEHYLDKGNLTHKDINHILSRIEEGKKAVFDKAYADSLYDLYMDHETDDSKSRRELGKVVDGKSVLLAAPGASLKKYKEEIRAYCNANRSVIFAVNYPLEDILPDYVVFTNNKRYAQYYTRQRKTVVTSNISGRSDYVINYNSIVSTYEQGNNSLVMLVRLMKELGADTIGIAGADGYGADGMQYCEPGLRSYQEHDADYNNEVKRALKRLDAKIVFVTPSLYEQDA